MISNNGDDIWDVGGYNQSKNRLENFKLKNTLNILKKLKKISTLLREDVHDI